VTAGRVVVIAEVEDVEDSAAEVEKLKTELDSRRGCLLSSSYEYPGRYKQWTLGFVNPPVVLECWGMKFSIRALNRRGIPFLGAISQVLKGLGDLLTFTWNNGSESIDGNIKKSDTFFPEEQRSKQPSIFSLIRAIKELFASDEDPHLGLYGAFGYDLCFQFEQVKEHTKRDPKQRDLVMYIPDELLVVNHPAKTAWRMKYDFVFAGVDGLVSTKGLDRDGPSAAFQPRTELPPDMPAREFAPGEFAKMVDVAKQKFACGDLFEAVLSQTFREPCKVPPSKLFTCIQKRNPSPYGFIFNLGEEEWLVGASPEMFVRVDKLQKGMRVETCPISGTIKRGKNALEDAENIKQILADPKEESEITMCTDVDRNDKSRICEHGSVRVIGRRQIELYSRLIHTVDHVEGYLRPGFDAIDAFLCHTWAVTVCGAPKVWAMQFVEEQERSQRCWYGASVGHIAFDGNLNTGLTLRTVKIKSGVGEVRAGATLLFDSVPESEEAETELKASASLNALRNPEDPPPGSSAVSSLASSSLKKHSGKVILLIDFEDSFVHTLANYLRQTGAEVMTVRHTQAKRALEEGKKPDFAVLSPGPGNPQHFGVSAHIARLVEMRIPMFGVCLGMQGIFEHFGGKLGQLPYPMHGKPSVINLVKGNGSSSPVLDGLPESFTVARYHSLYGKRPLPDCLTEIAHIAPGEAGAHSAGQNGKQSADEPILMGVQHKTLPIAAVQFHPESILTSPEIGLQMLANALSGLKYSTP
jgi:anthranilate synthase